MQSRTRIERAARRYAAPVTLASVAAIALGALWAADAAQAVERLESASIEGRFVEEGAFTYSVTVLRPSPAFREGTVLGMGEAGYFTTVAPRVDLAFRWSIPEPAGARAAAAVSLELVVSATSPTGRAYWTLRYPLAEATHAGAADEGVLLRAFFDFDRVLPDVANTTQALGANGARIAWEVVATAKYAADGPGFEARNASRFALPIDVDAPLYVLPDEDGARFVREHGTPRVRVEERVAGVAGVLERPLALAPIGLGIVGLALVVRERRPRPEDARGEERAFEDDVDKHEEWITHLSGPVPDAARGSRVLDVPTVAALVAVAAEAQRRVVLDAERVFWVLTPEAAYRCRRHARHAVIVTTTAGP